MSTWDKKVKRAWRKLGYQKTRKISWGRFWSVGVYGWLRQLMDTQMKATHQEIDQLFNEACKRGTTYEAVVHSCFCTSMRDVFGDDEQLDNQTQAAFKYARETYGYQSIDESQESEAKDWEDGICNHGLTWLTCPRGCFEE